MTTIPSKPAILETRWLTIYQAIGRIRISHGCTNIDAQRFLKRRIATRALPTKWIDGGSLHPSHLTYFSGTKLFLESGGLAFDALSEQYKQLLVLESSLVSSLVSAPTEDIPKQEQLFGSMNWEFNTVRWMTVVEASEHIESVMRCDTKTSLRLLKSELFAGIIRIGPAQNDFPAPTAGDLSSADIVLAGYGYAMPRRDPPARSEYIKLLLSRGDVLRIWPTSDPKAGAGEKSPGRPSYHDLINEALERIRLDNPSFLQKSHGVIAAKAADLIGITLGNNGAGDRAIKNHVSAFVHKYGLAPNIKMKK